MAVGILRRDCTNGLSTSTYALYVMLVCTGDIVKRYIENIAEVRGLFKSANWLFVDKQQSHLALKFASHTQISSNAPKLPL